MSSTHGPLAAEAAALLEVIATKLEHAADPAPAADADHDVRCTGCPLCAAMTYLKDHRELSAQVAQGALVIVGALRQYLDQHQDRTPAPTSGPPATSTVHPIDIS